MKELAELVLKYSKPDAFLPTQIKSLRIARSDLPTEPIQALYTPALCLIVQGEKEATVAGKSFRYSPSQYLVTSVDLPVTGQVTKASKKEPYLCLVIDLDPNVVFEVLRDTAGMASSSTASSHRGIFLDKVNPDLSDAALRLVRCLKNEVDGQVLAPMIIREITFRLLSSKYGEVVRQLGIANSQTQRIANVVTLIRKNYALPLKIEELARAANMSPSSFHQHFKQVTLMSPLQYQKQIRLQEARRLLSSEITDAASVGFKVGYESPSQFSREYARLFGLPPMSDMKRRRA